MHVIDMELLYKGKRIRITRTTDGTYFYTITAVGFYLESEYKYINWYSAKANAYQDVDSITDNAK